MCAPAGTSSVAVVTTQNSTRTGTHLDAGGVHTYYEVYGIGDPLVLMHGGLSTLEMLDPLAAALSEGFRVYAPERRGHGRTPDPGGPITFATMAADTIAFLDALGVTGAHLVGFSDGGYVALEVALARPDLVGKLVMMSAGAHPDGYTPEQHELFARWTGHPSPPMMAGFKELHGAVAPGGPDSFEDLFAKLVDVWGADPGHSMADLATVAAPTLVLLGDDDVLTIEHAAAIARAIPDAQLAVVPNTSHALPLEKPDLVVRLLRDFLAVEQPAKMMSLRELLAHS
jgi:pimeloyl-ACP methyl ester carboxylesterase